jgi:diguanylate cyclase (GGDEF)-like protein
MDERFLHSNRECKRSTPGSARTPSPLEDENDLEPRASSRSTFPHCRRTAVPFRGASRPLLCLLLFLLVCRTGSAQRFEAKLFDQSDGLGDLSVTGFAQQPDGSLWIATENGLFRYDGSLFTEFSRAAGLSDPTVFSLLVDHTGTVWVGTHGGLFRFDGTRFHEETVNGRSMRIGINSMLTVTPSGELIANTARGLVSIERSSSGWTAVPYAQRHQRLPNLGDDIDGVLVDARQNFWFGCSSQICELSGSQLRTYGAAQGVPKDYYVSLFRSRDGRLWARGREHILTWRAGDARMTDRGAGFPAGGMDTVFRRFMEDRAGDILTPTAKGFATWNGSAWTETTATGQGPLEGATSLFCDREGSLWIGTQGFGALESLGYRRWKNYGIEQGLRSPAVNTVAKDSRGGMWIGDNLGADILSADGRSFVPAPAERTLQRAAVAALAPDPTGGMWVGTLFGHIYHVDAAGRVDRRAALDGYIEQMQLGSDGTLWIASTEGLFTLATGADTTAHLEAFPAATLQGTTVSSLAFGPGGVVWAAGREGLVHILHGKATRIRLPGKATSLSVVARAPDGTLWLAGSMPGLLQVRVAGDAAVLLRSLTRPQLASDLVEFLGFDRAGRLWVGTDNGVNIVDGAKILFVSRGDGLIWNVCSGNSFYADRDGSVWIGTSLGIAHLLDPESVLHRGPFAARVETANYRGQMLRPGSTLPWNGGPLLVHFTGLTFVDNSGLVYHYTLNGPVSDAARTRQPFARFEDLPPGRYVLQVVAEDPGHAMYSSPAALSFRLTPPWWRTPYFFAFAGITLVALLRLVWRWRHMALLRRQERLEVLVATRTEELRKMAMYDGLTGLRNRKAIFAVLETAFARARASGERLSIALLDIDHFKQVNDTFGHLAGDAVLMQTAQRLSRAVRATDTVGRYGGEEFLIVFCEADLPMDEERCESLRRAVCSEPVQWNQQQVVVTCSIGVATMMSRAETITELLARADRALYRAKTLGRDRVEVAV